jgi:hypothetical protein
MNEPAKPISTWRKVVAAILDLLTIFFVGGFVVGYLSGGLTDNGFDLKGGPALILFALIIAYFVVGRKFAGGTLWQRILRA